MTKEDTIPRVYFSNRDFDDKWEDDDTGVLKVLIIPRNIFSLKGWKMALEFRNGFRCGFFDLEKGEPSD